MDSLRRKLVWLVASRVAILATLVVITVLLGRDSSYIWPVSHLAFIVSALSLIYALALKLELSPTVLIPLQLGNDVLLVTWLVYRTGDVQSPFNTLYLVVIFAASLLSSRRGIFAITLLSVSVASTVGGMILANALPRGGDFAPYDPAAIPAIQFNLAFTIVACLAVSVLSTALSDRQAQSDLDLAAATRGLADLRAFNERVIESMRSGLATADLEGRIVTFNRAAEEITGLSAAEVVGRPFSALFPETARTTASATANQAAGAPPVRSETAFRRPDDTVAHLGFSVTPLTAEDGARKGLVLIFQDVTEIVELEHEVRRREKLAALGTMAAGLAHEIRNPLASMRGSIQVLDGDLALGDDQKRLMQIVLRESDRLNRIVTDFLAYARQSPAEVSAFDLKRSLADAVVLLRNSPELKANHELVERLGATSDDVPFWGDQNQIRQVFWNLARNGLRAMPDGGRLTVRLDEPSPDTCLLVVEDEGVGMTDAQAETIFEPFSASESGGTGLGLAIVYRIVSEHGGRIQVESAPGAGTRVLVWLPRRGESALASASTWGDRAGAPAALASE